MPGFKRFTIAALLIWLGLLLIGGIYPWQRALKYRPYLEGFKERLIDLDHLPADKRILLVGSSPMVMGLSAAQIQADTAIETRNLGLMTARLFFDEYLAKISGHIRPGDIVIIADPLLIKRDGKKDSMHCIESVDFSCLGFAPHLFPNLYTAFLLLTRGADQQPDMKQEPNGDFMFSAYQEKIGSGSIAPDSWPGPFPADIPDKVSAIIRQVEQRGGCPIMIFLPILVKSGEEPRWQAEFQELWHHLDEKGIGDHILKSAIVTTDSKFFTMANEHLSEDGRRTQTQYLLEALHSGTLSNCAAIKPS